MKLLENIKRTLFTFGLEKQEYALIRDRIFEDDRRRLLSASMIVSAFLLVMLVVTSIVPELNHSQAVYLVATPLTLAHLAFSYIGKKHRLLIAPGVYSFMTVVFLFGMHQGVVTAPEEQTVSFLVLMVAVPVWFTMKPSYMIRFVYVLAGIYIACVVTVKTGYVRTADIVNTLVYATASALISSYYTVIKSKRLYAEYLTERLSRTDMLTGLGNRAACTEDTERYIARGISDDFTIIYLDVNELKRINDTLGHHAGDELIVGAADCIRQVFSKDGGCYRTGGDEFIVVGEFSEERFRVLSEEFEQTMENWTGNWVQQLRVSYGGAAAREVPVKDVNHITKLADQRLYQAKALYYSTIGIDRREYQKVYRTLCDSYIKILQADLKTDTCKVIRAEIQGREGVSGIFSGWMEEFGNSGRVHPDDLAEYKKKTNIQYLREAFRSGKSTVHLFYRRKLGNEFRAVMAEFMASSEYSEENQIIYLSIKNIDRAQ